MLIFSQLPLPQALGLTFLVTAGLLLFVGWVFWKINPPNPPL